MIHTPILPVIIPLIAGFTLLLIKRFGLKTQEIFSLISVFIIILVSIFAFTKTLSNDIFVYSLGNWEAPFGIVLVLDQFSILMVLVTSLLAFGALWYAISEGIDKKGAHFHPLFQLQLFGLNGAFLTGDLFNLFVFFEILLLASYSLLLHAKGEGRVKAGLHYVVINLVGSTLFLFAVGTLYGILGTLNIADLSQKVAHLSPENVSIVASAGLLLLIVFGLKAAMFPLYFWLPNAYGKTSAPVAALFAIMTKVGIYSIIRVHGTIFGQNANELAFYYTPWVLYIGLITLVLATFGVLSSKELKTQISYLVLLSVSIILIAIGINSKEALSGAIFYMIHSTFVAGGFFLPPFSGFFGKIMILKSSINHTQTALILTTVLLSSLLVIVSLARSGTNIFYDTRAKEEESNYKLSKSTLSSIVYLFSFTIILVLFANNITQITENIASNLVDTNSYISTVLNPNGEL